MTSWNINFCSLLVYGCVASLFIRNVYSYPQKEFVFPNLDEDFEIETTTVAASIKDEQAAISNTNHMNRHINTRSYSSHDSPTLYDGTYNNGELFSPNAWPENESNNEWNQSVQNDITQFHERHNGYKSLIFSNVAGTQVEQKQINVQQQNGVSTTVAIDTFVFPTEVARTQPSNPQSTISKPQGSDCEHSIFCENVSHYPEEIINRVIQRNDSLKYLATVDEVPEIVERFNSNEASLCKSNPQLLYPRAAKSKEKGWLTVVNQDNLKQAVQMEICANENGECDIAGTLTRGYKSSCVQKYINRKLLALTDSNEVAQEVFPIPISCCCHLTFSGTAVERFGIGSKQGSQTTTAKNQKDLFNSVNNKRSAALFYGELEFSKQLENSESSKNETTATVGSLSTEENQVSISNVNYINRTCTNLLFDGIYNSNELFSTSTSPENDSNNRCHQSIGNGTTRYYVIHNGNETLISVIGTQVKKTQNSGTYQGVSTPTFQLQIPKNYMGISHGIISEPVYSTNPINSCFVSGFLPLDKSTSCESTNLILNYLLAPKLSSNHHEEQLCETRYHKIFPKVQLTETELDRVEDQENLKQGVAIELCVDENKQCSLDHKSIPLGYKTACIQNYKKINITIIKDKTRNKVTNYSIPSGCFCCPNLIGR